MSGCSSQRQRHASGELKIHSGFALQPSSVSASTMAATLRAVVAVGGHSYYSVKLERVPLCVLPRPCDRPVVSLQEKTCVMVLCVDHAQDGGEVMSIKCCYLVPILDSFSLSIAKP